MTCKIIVTREKPPSPSFLDTVHESGFELVHLPLITCRPNQIPETISTAIPKANWIFFTSAVAFKFFEPFMPKTIKIATIGTETSKAVRSSGFTIDFEAKSHYGIDFVNEWLSLHLENQTILFPQSSLSKPIMAQLLQEKEHTVLAWTMYDTVPDCSHQKQLDDLRQSNQLVWTFTSPSAWESLIGQVKTIPKRHAIAVIGKTTAQAVAAFGYDVSIMPEQPSFYKMIMATIKKGDGNDFF